MAISIFYTSGHYSQRMGSYTPGAAPNADGGARREIMTEATVFGIVLTLTGLFIPERKNIKKGLRDYI